MRRTPPWTSSRARSVGSWTNAIWSESDSTRSKVPHHGEAPRNLAADLLSLVPADHYLFSSDGSRFGHPDSTGVARCLEYGKPRGELLFNYESPQTLLWDDEELLGGFTARYPSNGQAGIGLKLPPSEGSTA